MTAGTGNPLQGVTATLDGAEATSTQTDETGAFGFIDLPAGSYVVSISGFPQDVTFPSTELPAEVGPSGGRAVLAFVGHYPPLVVASPTLPRAIVGVHYAAQLEATGGHGGLTWVVTSGSTPPGLTVSADGEISGTPAESGTFAFEISIESGDGQSVSVLLTLDVSELLTIVTESLPAGVVGTGYFETLMAEGGEGSYAWALIDGSLPTGLTLSPTTGEVSGTPTTAGSNTVTVEVSSAEGQTATKTLILAAWDGLVITTSELERSQLGRPYDQPLSATGGDGVYTWSVADGALPTGLVLGTGGHLSGNATDPGLASFTLEVTTGDGQSAHQPLSVLVILGPESFCADYSPSDIASFEDAALEATVREALAIGPDDDILCGPLGALTGLDGNGDGISRLEGLQNLTGLASLNLGNNSIEDVGPLAGLTDITFLTLGNNGISDLSPLAGLTAVADLFLNDNLIADLAPLENLASIRQLRIDNNAISDLGPLSGMTGMNYLIMSNNEASDIGPLSAMTALHVLTAGNNGIQDLGALAGKTELTNLSLFSNAVTDLSPLSGLTSLTDLHLGSNSISDVTPLSGLTGLVDLNLSRNAITDVSSLASLTALSTRLDLADNGLVDVSPLSALTNLTYLRLSLNAILELDSLQSLVLLSNVLLDSNPTLSDLQPLLDNTGLGAGDRVDVRSTSVSCADVALLEAQGVTVESDCP